MLVEMYESQQLIPSCRGSIYQAQPLADLTWMRVGGPAEWFFQPKDIADLSNFLRQLDSDVPVFVMGVGSNIIVRDGGIKGVVIRLGRSFAGIEFKDGLIRVGASVLLARLAKSACELGHDLAFLRTIPGTVGGAVRMNAGCYGSYVADVFQELVYVSRKGCITQLTSDEVGFGYRSSKIPEGAVIVEAVFKCPKGDPLELQARMESQLRLRSQTQPKKSRTAGSTFKNPAGFSSTGKADDSHELKAWKLIDDAGMRGVKLGSAAVSDLHPNFLINLGDANATQIEKLGERIREKVFQTHGIMLKWEIIIVGAARKEANIASQ